MFIPACFMPTILSLVLYTTGITFLLSINFLEILKFFGLKLKQLCTKKKLVYFIDFFILKIWPDFLILKKLLISCLYNMFIITYYKVFKISFFKQIGLLLYLKKPGIFNKNLEIYSSKTQIAKKSTVYFYHHRIFFQHI